MLRERKSKHRDAGELTTESKDGNSANERHPTVPTLGQTLPASSRSTVESPLPLALRAKDAASLLGISPRLLWSLTNRGEVPHLRLGRAVLYPVDDLRRWLSEQASRPGESR